MRLIKNRLIAFAVFAILLIAPTHKALSQQKELIYGEWVFEKYELKDGSSTNASDKTNKGLTLLFLANGKFKSTHPSLEQNNFDGVFRYYPDKKNLVIEKSGDGGYDKIRVAFLDKTTLKLFYDDEHPIVVFKKK